MIYPSTISGGMLQKYFSKNKLTIILSIMITLMLISCKTKSIEEFNYSDLHINTIDYITIKSLYTGKKTKYQEQNDLEDIDSILSQIKGKATNNKNMQRLEKAYKVVVFADQNKYTFTFYLDNVFLFQSDEFTGYFKFENLNYVSIISELDRYVTLYYFHLDNECPPNTEN